MIGIDRSGSLRAAFCGTGKEPIFVRLIGYGIGQWRERRRFSVLLVEPPLLGEAEVKFSIKSQSLIALAATAVMTSGMAAAGDAIDVKNVADPVRHPYQQTASVNCGGPSSVCLVTFPAITTARTLVRHVSCAFSLVKDDIVGEVFLSDSTLQIRSFLPITTYADAVGGGENFYAISGDPYAFFETGQTPTIEFLVLGPSNDLAFSCTLAGYYL